MCVRRSGACACGRPADYVRAAVVVVASSRSAFSSTPTAQQRTRRLPLAVLSSSVSPSDRLSHSLSCSPPPPPYTTHKHSSTDRHPRRSGRALSLANRRPCRIVISLFGAAAVTLLSFAVTRTLERTHSKTVPESLSVARSYAATLCRCSATPSSFYLPPDKKTDFALCGWRPSRYNGSTDKTTGHDERLLAFAVPPTCKYDLHTVFIISIILYY